MKENREQLGVHGALDTLAQVAISQHDPVRGVRLAGAAAHLRRLNGLRSWPVVERRLDERLTAAQATLSPEDYQDLWDDGYSMTASDALTFALRP
jgi:hypothetical protein